MFFKSNTQAVQEATKGTVIHIVAKDLANGIGKDNLLPWNYSEDLRHFAELTKGKQNIYTGFNTFQSLCEYAKNRTELLPGRLVHVVTNRDIDKPYLYKKGMTFTHQTVLHNLIHKHKAPVIIIGGAALYKMHKPDVVFVTEIQSTHDCDTFYHWDLEKGYTKFEIKQSVAPNLIKYYMYIKDKTIC